MRHLLFAALALTALPAAAAAQLPQDVNAHIIYTGTGGTALSKEGVDFWTAGQTPRRYRVLGTIVDRRGSGRFSGNAVGSAGVAKQVKKLGGDGVLVMSQAPDYGDQIATTMMVVKYVE
ncbi:MAG: hypothetical protein Q7J32_03105 [Sphingomonadaceae bacterium]|nr:hypothetical protein [Sphingomonadaceae bacterium]